jgi:hypothetical protein
MCADFKIVTKSEFPKIPMSIIEGISGSDFRLSKIAAVDPKPNLTTGWQLRLWA